MGICSSSRKNSTENNAYNRAITSLEAVWEINVSILVKYMNDNNISKSSLSKKPLLCNYIVLEKSGDNVTHFKMDNKSGTYKKYITDHPLRWHLSLKGLPECATVLLKDKHLHNLHRVKSLSPMI
jgi:hypothetical protein